MRVLRAISLFCLTLLVLGMQCRVKCIVIPHSEAAAKHPPGCPLHKQQVPAHSDADSKKCSHAPQWDFDDVKMLALLPDSRPSVTFARLGPVADLSLPLASFTPPIQTNLRI